MPITPFLRGQLFDLDHLAAMEKAFVTSCEALGLSDRTPLVNEIVAGKIIELAQSRMRNPTALYFAVMKDLIPSDRELRSIN